MKLGPARQRRCRLYLDAYSQLIPVTFFVRTVIPEVDGMKIGPVPASPANSFKAARQGEELQRGR